MNDTAIQEEIEVYEAVWTSPERLPEHVKIADVARILKYEMANRHLKLGDTVQVNVTKPLRPSEDLFQDIIGWDRYGPRFTGLRVNIPFTWTRTVQL